MKKHFIASIIIFLIIFSISCNSHPHPPISPSPHPVQITYWQYWTGFEGKAIEKLVDKFNKTHSNIKVKMLTISEPRKKTLLSIIGGTPPDVISSIAAWVPELASKGAIT